MAKTIVYLTDTFNSFKTKVNDISDDIGDITLLTTTVDSDVVGALNNLHADIGNVSTLTTTGTTLVAAINEHDGEIGNMILTGLSATDVSQALRELRVELGDVGTLTTTADSDVVGAVNELDAEIGTLTSLSTTDKSTLIAAINEVHDHTTTNIEEGTNQYYTQARFNTAFGAKSTSDLSEGTNLYYTDSAARAAHSGTNVGTGYGALAYDSDTGEFAFTKVTDANIRSRFSAANAGAGFGALSYNGTTGQISFEKVTAADVRSNFSAGANITISANGLITADVSGIDSASIQNNSILSRHIVAGTIESTDIKDLAITTDKLAAAAVTGDKIFSRTIVGSKISQSADLSVATIDTTGNVTIGGSLTVTGTTTTINSNTVELGDNIILLNNDVTGAPTENAGLEIERGTSTNVLLRFNETSDRWEFTNNGSDYNVIPNTTEYDNYGNWILRDDENAEYSQTSGDTLQIVGGTGISSLFTADDVLEIATTDAGSNQNIFKKVAVSGQSNILADSNDDTLNFAGGTNVTITTNATTDTVTIASANTTDFSIANNAGTAQFVVSEGESIRFEGGTGIDAVFDAGTQKVTYNVAAAGIDTDELHDDAVTADKLASVETLVIKNSLGQPIKTLYGAGG
jgi:hypothetical protein